MKHRNAFVARLARSAYRTKYAHERKIFIKPIFRPRGRNVNCISQLKNFKLTLAKVLLPTCISVPTAGHFFYLSSVSYQNSHHVSVKSCVVILHAADSGVGKTNILRQVAPHKTASRFLTAVFNTINTSRQQPPTQRLRGRGVRLLWQNVGKN